MTPPALHTWTLDPVEAIRIQESLREELVLTWDNRMVSSVGGVGIVDGGDCILAAVAVLSYPDLSLVDTAIAQFPAAFPYIPGLLAFRLAPAILAAWENITAWPDVLMVPAHGTAHPRGFGLASHIGLWLGVPSIGVAKQMLFGHLADVGPMAGDWSKLTDEHDSMRVIGAVLRTRVNTKPIYVSPGHLTDLQRCIEVVLACCRVNRLPEPLRAAHQFAARVKMGTSQVSES